MDVFKKLAPYIQDYIYQNNWSELREVQVAACDIIFNTDNNLLLSSGTASGKTEAAFLPTLTNLYEKPSKSVGILYISPLKALINDQFVRLDFLLSESNIPVCKWHGDASLSAKNKLLKNPQGILQITPESLQSLLINKKEVIFNLFNDLRFVIIDEVHYFMGSPRGIQLLCILEQIQKIAECAPRRIGLSATLGNYSSAEKWLNSGSSRKCSTPIVNSGKKKICLSMQRFISHNDSTENELDSGFKLQIKYLYEKSLEKKTIIFANSRSEVESIIANIRQVAEENKTKDIYRVHHGNISAALREETERDMKNSEDSIVTGATVTLELGIDLGSLDRVIQVGAPISSLSFTQRIGRCGRRGQPAELLFTFIDKDLEQSSDPIRFVNWEFIKTIAIIQLFIEENWVEPIPLNHHPYALIYHQTMCYLISNGETSAALLAQNILGLSIFKNITQADYKLLLNHLIRIKHLEKTERGGLIIGINAEKIINNYNFYSVFESPVEYLVKNNNFTIGTVSMPYPIGSKFSLAGRTWESIELNDKSKVIFVELTKGTSKTKWIADANVDIHTHIIQKMKEILICDETYAYLSDSCKERLYEIRSLVNNSKITKETITPISNTTFAIFPWIGTKILITLFYLLEQKEIKCTIMPDEKQPIYLEVKYYNGLDNLEKELSDICNSPINKNAIPLPENIKVQCKYNEYIPKELLRKQFVEDYLDCVELNNILKLNSSFSL